jgi:hypothetical protein
MAFGVQWAPNLAEYGASLANAAAQRAAKDDYQKAMAMQLQHNQMMSGLMGNWMKMKQASDAAQWQYRAHTMGTPAERAELERQRMVAMNQYMGKFGRQGGGVMQSYRSLF